MYGVCMDFVWTLEKHNPKLYVLREKTD